MPTKIVPRDIGAIRNIDFPPPTKFFDSEVWPTSAEIAEAKRSGEYKSAWIIPRSIMIQAHSVRHIDRFTTGFSMKVFKGEIPTDEELQQLRADTDMVIVVFDPNDVKEKTYWERSAKKQAEKRGKKKWNLPN